MSEPEFPELAVAPVPEEVWSRALQHTFDPDVSSDDALVPVDDPATDLTDVAADADVAAGTEVWDLAAESHDDDASFDPFGLDDTAADGMDDDGTAGL